MTRLFLIGLALAAGSVAASAQTPAVDTARATGVVGERYDGYMGIPGAASSLLRSQVGTINIQRRTLYSRLGSARGASPQDVGVTAGCTLLERTPIGGAYLLSDGVWRKREAGQPAPRPDYCG